MSSQCIIPDSPFRSGTTSKYKLLIQRVSTKVDGYEYELVDAENREYKAISKEHYPEGQLLRCIVTFEVKNATLVVTNTTVCKKQDMATLIPENKVTQDKKTLVAETPKVKSSRLDDPYKNRTTGVYNLIVVEATQGEKRFSYLLEDICARRYKAESKHHYAVGSIIPCLVKVVISRNGPTVTVSSMGKRQKPHKRIKHSGTSSREWLPSPAVGDHFHLIYTPMGNKR